MEAPLSDFWPGLLDRARELHTVFSWIAMILVFAGVLIAAYRGTTGDPGLTLRAVLSAGIIAVVMVAFPSWVDQLQMIAHSIVQILDSDPSRSHERFARLIAGPSEAGKGDVGFWDVLWAEEGGMGKAFLYAIILGASKLALAVMYLAFVLQQIALVFGISVSPIFLGMLLLPSTKEIAGKFILSLISLIAWPVGWGIADILTSELLTLAVGGGTDGQHAALEAGQGFFFVIVLSLWLLASTVAAPYAITKALQGGVQVGTALMGSFASGLGQGGSYALGAGVTASMNGGSALTTSAAAVTAGIGGLMGGAAGSSGMILPAAIGTMAVVAGSSPRVEDVSGEAAEIANRERNS